MARSCEDLLLLELWPLYFKKCGGTMNLGYKEMIEVLNAAQIICNVHGIKSIDELKRQLKQKMAKDGKK